jgi:hypothetical protein
MQIKYNRKIQKYFIPLTLKYLWCSVTNILVILRRPECQCVRMPRERKLTKVSWDILKKSDHSQRGFGDSMARNY